MDRSIFVISDLHMGECRDLLFLVPAENDRPS